MSEHEWKDMAEAWKGHDADLDASDEALQSRLRRQRILLALQTAAEVLAFVAAVILAIWIARHSLKGYFGEALLGWLLAQALIVVWLRGRSGRTAQMDSVCDELDASIERDRRVVGSMRLGGVMGMVALAAAIMAFCTTLLRHPVEAPPITLLALGVLAIYVFAVQTAVGVYSRRVRRRRERLEEIRSSLRATH